MLKDMAAYEQLSRSIEESVRCFCEGKRVGIAFSGGMDSGLVAALAKRYARSVICYTCGTDDSFDVGAGKELAEKLDLPWVHCRISEENIEDDIRELILSTKVSDPFTISYELQLFTVCRAAGERVILSGQGSDEYFGGRCRELLIPGAEVFLSVSDNPLRKTAYDLVAVRKGPRLINMDSQIPNDVAEEDLRRIPLE